MRVHEFLDLVAHETRAALPPRFRSFRSHKRYTLIQLSYGRRTIHYELWIRGNVKTLEIGLHCEADRATNTALLQLLDRNLFEIKEALGEHVEAEQWTNTWTRVHELMPYERLDAATARAAAQRLAAMITVLQPIVEPGMRTRVLRALGKARASVRSTADLE